MSNKAELEKKCIDTIRFLAADAIEKAKSGHPGMPLGAAAAAFALWTKHLKHNPKNPQWPDRDRFVLSSGHASMLLYALLHLTGYDLSLDDIKNFRQWGSRTPGHPEYKHVPGVEVTTGPLGQGLANAVGMAIAEAHLGARFNRDGANLVDHFTYVMAGDGDMMEGVTAEACSLAGHLRLGKLIVLYDDNRVTLAGSAALSCTENIEQRFKAYGWQVQKVADGNDVAAIDRAIKKAKRETEKPSLICVQSTIGYGAPGKQGSCDAHGSPLGEKELRGAKDNCAWPVEEPFRVPEDVQKYFRKALLRGKKCEKQWQDLLDNCKQNNPAITAEFERITRGVLPENWESALSEFPKDSKDVATRKAGEIVMQSIAAKVPELAGGSADLNPSTFTWLKGLGDFQSPAFPATGLHGMVGGPWGYEGRNIHFGVREHAMGSIAVGMALHGGIIPYTATFLPFADYMRPPMRLAALMGIRTIFVFTHDSIGVGEDGPTHQPIEQIMNLRQVPNMTVIRPADANETLEAWRLALTNTGGPTTLVFSRQNLPVLDRSICSAASGTRKGGYILWESAPDPELILIATGSEVSLSLSAARKLAENGTKVRVVSLPSWEIFDRQPRDYRGSVLPPALTARIAVEAGIKLGWEHYVGLSGKIIGMETFGASAPGSVLYEKFGFTTEKIIAAAQELLHRASWGKMTETRINYSLGEYQSAVNGALEKIRADNVISRLWAKDFAVWKQKPDEIINRLGWLDAPAETLKKMDDIHAAIDPLTRGSISDVVLLGMGGSSLAAEVFNNIFGSKTGYPQLQIVDTTDPVFISTVTKRLNLEKTVFLVSSKSGTTLEIISLFKYFYNLALKNSGSGAGRRFIFITDEGSPLIKIAKNISAHHTFLNNPDIGGRYSALSLPGIIPAAMIGVDVVKLLQRAIDAKLSDSGASLGAALGTLAQMGRDKLTFIMPSDWQSFGDWLEQLIAESTGKEGKGILPILNEPLLESAAYGQDRVFVVFQNKETVISSQIESLTNVGHPVIRVNISDDYDLGAQMFIWEMATAIAAHFLNINPFDQPDVETTKKYTRVMITEHKEKKNMIDAKPALTFAQGDIFGKISGATLAEVFKNFLKQAAVDNYISLQIYLSPSGEIDTAVRHLREAISKKLALPVTFGYGPRYLHSTGQLHKGDSGKGLFIQFTQDNALDVDIPDDPGKAESSLTFGALKAAQAKGDWRALQDKGRRIIRIHFRENPIDGFKNLADLL